MNISPISQNKQNFQHLGKSHGENSYSKKERAVITGMTVWVLLPAAHYWPKNQDIHLTLLKCLKILKNLS